MYNSNCIGLRALLEKLQQAVA